MSPVVLASLASAGTHPPSVSLSLWHCPLRLHLSIPCRYHNNTLLDPSLYKHDGKLLLKNLQRDQAGEYFCKAQSDAGAVKSQVAQLIVIGKPGRVPGEPLLQDWGHLSGHNWAVKTPAFLCYVQCYVLWDTRMSQTPILPSRSCHPRRGKEL